MFSYETFVNRLDKFVAYITNRISIIPTQDSIPYGIMVIIYLLFIFIIILFAIAIIIMLFTGLQMIGGIVESIKYIFGPFALILYIFIAFFLGLKTSKSLTGDNFNSLFNHIASVFKNYISLIFILLILSFPSSIIFSLIEVVTNEFYTKFYQSTISICIFIAFFIGIFSLIIFFIKNSFSDSNENNSSLKLFNISFIFLLSISFMTSFKTMTTYLLKNIFAYKCAENNELDICSASCSDRGEGDGGGGGGGDGGGGGGSGGSENRNNSPLISKYLLVLDDATARNENKPLYVVSLILLGIYIFLVIIMGYLIITDKFKPMKLSTDLGNIILDNLLKILDSAGLEKKEPAIMRMLRAKNQSGGSKRSKMHKKRRN